MKRLLAILLLAACSACGGSSAVAPSGLGTIPADPTINFNGLTGNGSPFGSYTESGFTISATTNNWVVSATYGRPAPFVEFWAEAGATATGELLVSAAGSGFYFQAVDLYSSTTPIPYTFVGTRNSATVFAVTGSVPNTFGNFRTVSNPQSAVLIDTLRISLTDPAAPCCRNPVGLDNIVLTPTPTTPSGPTAFALSGRVTDSATGAAIAGAGVLVKDGPNSGRGTATDSAGNYKLDQLIASTFSVTVSAGGYASQTRTVTLAADQTMSVQLVSNRTVPTPSGATTIGFGGLTANGAPVSSYTEAGFTVAATSGPWQAMTTYGNPAPFIEFLSSGRTTSTGEIRVTSGGSTFSFYSVDLYSSTTTIPYTIVGSRGGSTIFTLKDTVPNTFGAFRTVTNPNAGAVVDAISIVLTNPAAPCCPNPVGLDTVVLTR